MTEPVVRGVGRHLRARGCWAVAAAVLVVVAGAWLAADWLSSRPFFDGPRARPPVVVLAPLLVAVLVSRTLAGDDVELERSVPRLTARWRAGHAAVVAVLPAAGLATTVLTSPAIFGAGAVVRNTLGLVGLVLLAVVVLPARVAWAPPALFTVVVYLSAPRSPGGSAAWWAWTMQPGRPDASWVVAAVLIVAGVLGYARRGPALGGG